MVNTTQQLASLVRPAAHTNKAGGGSNPDYSTNWPRSAPDSTLGGATRGSANGQRARQARQAAGGLGYEPVTYNRSALIDLPCNKAGTDCRPEPQFGGENGILARQPDLRTSDGPGAAREDNEPAGARMRQVRYTCHQTYRSGNGVSAANTGKVCDNALLLPVGRWGVGPNKLGEACRAGAIPRADGPSLRRLTGLRGGAKPAVAVSQARV